MPCHNTNIFTEISLADYRRGMGSQWHFLKNCEFLTCNEEISKTPGTEILSVDEGEGALLNTEDFL